MTYPYFGFQQPNVGQQLMQPNAFFNPATQYQGAMPAELGGVGASPMDSVQQGMTPNMGTMLPLGMMGLQLLNQAHPGQRPGLMQQAAPALMGLMANPQMRQQIMQGAQGLAGGIGSLFSGGAGAAAGV